MKRLSEYEVPNENCCVSVASSCAGLKFVGWHCFNFINLYYGEKREGFVGCVCNVSKCAVISEREDIGEQSFSAILSGFRSAQVGLSMENKSHWVFFNLGQITMR